MTDQKHSAQDQPTQSQPSPEGGDKDTSTLHNIKDVQKEGMLEKGRQVDQTPQSVKDTDQGQHPQQLPRR
ncbi:hypothetical protein GCM10017783_16990 [Deinococcus piscis]|uniref:Uncharacterized protein n=1 Tax=Deinococcus piscis TaxID=394230 RepID=A0ABQ3K9L9_9DEIO|nr:hypothetical protein [Deinococcus piscis]GHG04994.1 hypothetical protein GCM10017783_16990 [Deinococcus piscis]